MSYLKDEEPSKGSPKSENTMEFKIQEYCCIIKDFKNFQIF